MLRVGVLFYFFGGDGYLFPHFFSISKLLHILFAASSPITATIFPTTSCGCGKKTNGTQEAHQTHGEKNPEISFRLTPCLLWADEELVKGSRFGGGQMELVNNHQPPNSTENSITWLVSQNHETFHIYIYIYFFFFEIARLIFVENIGRFPNGSQAFHLDLPPSNPNRMQQITTSHRHPVKVTWTFNWCSDAKFTSWRSNEPVGRSWNGCWDNLQLWKATSTSLSTT